jgi:predicted hotdog family 3-hydroxylacyl-ACP dehydratase
LRTRSGLLATALIEYAAQAMALHGALVGRAEGLDIRPGYLASVRGTQLHVLTLHDLPPAEPDELRITATRQAGDQRQILYAFSAQHAGCLLAEGRAAVVLNTPAPTP